MLTALVILVVMGSIVGGVFLGASWLEQRQEERQAALQSQMQAMMATLRLSSFAWETRQDMYQEALEKRRGKAS
ncbi:MAG: hypothetical protein M1565_04385 [Actinobacteria bacterium]|nr:hypothetical protein [Actinomycetota bacterium]MCL5735215.1 hypothetical protein [Actinomycetota bacterium]